LGGIAEINGIASDAGLAATPEKKEVQWNTPTDRLPAPTRGIFVLFYYFYFCDGPTIL
jgi:hypothetical protein